MSKKATQSKPATRTNKTTIGKSTSSQIPGSNKQSGINTLNIMFL